MGNGDGMDDRLEESGWEEIEEEIGICFLPSAFSWSDDLRHVLSPIKDGSGAGKWGGGVMKTTTTTVWKLCTAWKMDWTTENGRRYRRK